MLEIAVIFILLVTANVADLDPYIFGLLDPDPLVRGMDPDPSFIKQK
jgi:hypothetical protein